jgi:hypothetical protein
MSQLRSLIWKEWHETRAFLWIGLGVFIGLPVASGLEAMVQYAHRFEISASPWVMGFGGVLAIFVAAGATCRDLRGVMEFWRSRPIGVLQWMLVKYFVGLAVVLAACVLPLGLELEFSRGRDAIFLMVWMPFFWTALFSLGFAAGCLVRNTAHAAILGMVGMLLVYVLPLLLPPIGWMNVEWITEIYSVLGTWPTILTSAAVKFAAGMAVLSLLGAIIALLAVRRDWRIQSGRKMLYASISAALLILFATVGVELGTNLPVLQQIDLPKTQDVFMIHCDGRRGFVMTWKEVPITVGGNTESQMVFQYRSLELGSSGIVVQSPRDTVSGLDPWQASRAAWLSGERQIAYWPIQVREGYQKSEDCVLYVDEMGGPYSPIKTVHLWTRHLSENEYEAPPVACIWKGSLYVIGHHATTLDISDPLNPRVMSDKPLALEYVAEGFDGSDQVIVALPAVAGLPARQVLEAEIHRPFQPCCLEGDILCTRSTSPKSPGWLLAYRLIKLTDSTAVFQKIGDHRPTMLENIFGQYFWAEISMANGLLYVSNGASFGGGSGVNPSVSVYDTKGPHPLRLVGHFAAPGVRDVFPLPDGRAIVGGSKLWLLGPPPRRDQN